MISCALFIWFSQNCAKQLNWLNSKFVIATTSQPYNRFSLNFRVFYLVCLILPYLFSYCKTAPKQLNQLNSNLLQLLLLNHSTKWADIFRVYSLTLLITIDYATIEKSYTSIVSFANSNTFSLVESWNITKFLSPKSRNPYKGFKKNLI